MEAVTGLAALYAPDVRLHEYVDWGVSGRKDDRPGYVALKADIAAGKVCCVFSYSLSRLGRSNGELDAFFRLCAAHDVTVYTKAEGALGKTSAMGGFLLTVMSAMAELESELAKERSAVAREARLARHDIADALIEGKLPNSVPAYGFVHVKGDDKVVRRELDPNHPIEPIFAAYREAGTLRGAVLLLNEKAGEPVFNKTTGEVIGVGKGIAAPLANRPLAMSKRAADKGAPMWGSSTLLRVLKAHDATILPEHSATGRQRPLGQPALFRKLLVCHCGRLMTPNIARKQYRCAIGFNRLARHGRSTVSERALKADLWPEVNRQYRPFSWKYAETVRGEIDALQARRDRIGALLLDDALKGLGLFSPAKAMAETAAIDSKLERLQRQQTAITGIMQAEPIDLNDPNVEETNRRLRAVWLRVNLDLDMRPTVTWIIDPDEARARDEAEAKAYLAEHHDEIAATVEEEPGMILNEAGEWSRDPDADGINASEK